jgi:lysophospholipase L1-like esterase
MPSADIVCLGDSLTYGYMVRRSAVWPGLAARESGLRLLNRGVNGELTSGMLAGFSRAVLAERPRAVLLMGGANDIFSLEAPEKASAAALANMESMARLAVAAGIRPLVGIPLPFHLPVREDWAAETDFARASRLYDGYAEALTAWSAARGYYAVNFREGVRRALESTGEDPEGLYLDGIHLTERGHRLFADILLRALRELGFWAGAPA